MADVEKLERLAKLVRYYILRMTTKAGSGHPTSGLSAVELMVALFFHKLRFDLKDPQNPTNDRVIFSKGHASSLLYALYGAAGQLTEGEIDSYRKFESPLEGHPTPRFKFAEVATGSLGQGLSIGVGMALAMKSDYRLQTTDYRLPKVYVLTGDSEFAEGSIWEALEVASYYKLDNLVGIIDVNRLGQSGQTMLGWDVQSYRKRLEAFGWQAFTIDGHDLEAIVKTLESVSQNNSKPKMIIAKTIKGKGVSFLEDKEGWHGRTLSEADFEKALEELGEVDKSIRGEIARPVSSIQYQLLRKNTKHKIQNTKYGLGEMVATRKAYGEAIAKLGASNPDIVCLDAEVKNSTFAEIFKEKFPERFFEMFIAEQNMVGVALGLSKRGKIPFVSTFGVFLTRAFDQIRMTSYSQPNVKFVGSHAGVAIGEDGPSQMGLEDLAMFRTIHGSIIFCPADAISCEKLVEIAAYENGLFYIRTNRPATPIIYKEAEAFSIGGSKTVRKSASDQLTIVACGVTLDEAIKACDELAKEGINVCVIDAYSIKPIDEQTLKEAAFQTNNFVMTVEDHYHEGGLGDAVLNVFAQEPEVKVYKLAVSKIPMSGKPEELLDYEGISASAISQKVKEVLG